MTEVFKSTNNLGFEVAHHPLYMAYRIGTCHGQWGVVNKCYYILSVINNSPGNGHLNDVFEWFEFACKRDNYNLMVLEIVNSQFYLHLITKKGFIPLDADGINVIKVFNKPAYEDLLKNGNEIIQAGTLKCL